MRDHVKQYAERDHMQLDRDGNYYCRHVAAMTAEGLHAKSDIAAELAWRDLEIDRLRAAPSMERVRIEKPEGLDPITVYLEDYGNGQGRAVIACYSSAWVCFWGAMGNRSLRQFIASCDEHYVSGVMLSMSHGRVTEGARHYAARVARAVIANLKAGEGSES